MDKCQGSPLGFWLGIGYTVLMHDILNLYKTEDFIVVDIETTGLSAYKGDAIIELAAERLRGGQVIGEFEHFINPGVPINPDAEAVHGISNFFIQEHGRPLEEIIPKFFQFAQGAVLVGHNIVNFDLSFINKHLDELALPRLESPVVDTLRLARRTLSLPNYKLGTVARHLGVSYDGAHRAMRDVAITRQVFLELLRRFG